MKEIQNKNLELCRNIAKYLKEKYPNEIFAIKENSIVAFRTKSRLCRNKSMSSMAHYHNSSPPRICIKQKLLVDGRSWTCEYEFGHQKRGTGYYISGIYGLIDLVCHELAHHRTRHHGKKWYQKYLKFRDEMLTIFESGEFYKVFKIEEL